MKEIRIIDQTFRDAHQCLWASRMTTGMMLPVAEKMDRIGFESIDLAGAVHCDVGVRYLKENPFEKNRLMREKIKRTPMICTIRSTGGIGFNVVPNDISLLWIERLLASGMRIFRVFDPLLDLDNNIYQLNYAKELGAYTTGVLAYGHSPVHTDELYAKKAKELVERRSTALSAEPTITRAWLLACLDAMEAVPVAVTPAPEADPLAGWRDDERVLVVRIRDRTGVVPTLQVLGDTRVVMFFLRDRDGAVLSRCVVVGDQYDALVIALRAVARIVKLDLVGPPLHTPQGER